MYNPNPLRIIVLFVHYRIMSVSVNHRGFSMSNTGDEMLLYLAKNINGFLSANNCTEAEAARGAGLNLTTINNWVCKKAYPRWKNLIKLADYFGCPIYELIEDPERRDKSQRFLTQWQRSLLAADQESPEIHNLFMEICKAGNEQDKETLIRLLEYIRTLNRNKE